MSKYLVYTGNLYPHKNVSIAIRAAEQLSMPLKIIAAKSIFANQLPSSPFVQYLGRLSDNEVKEVYKGAFAFVFPSLIEGFGLPGLEAMAVGLPVIAAKSSCLPEVYQDAALYFDPSSVEDLVNKVHLLMNNNKLRRELIQKGKLQVSKYSWAKMAQMTWQIYLDVLQ